MVILNFILRSYLPVESSLRSSYSIFPVLPQTGWCLRGKKRDKKWVKLLFEAEKHYVEKVCKHTRYSIPSHIPFDRPTCILLYSVEEKMPRLCAHKQPVLCGEKTKEWKKEPWSESSKDAIRHKLFSVKLCVVTQFIETWTCSSMSKHESVPAGYTKCQQQLTPGRKTVNLKRKLFQNRHRFIRVMHLEAISLIYLETNQMDKIPHGSGRLSDNSW